MPLWLAAGQSRHLVVGGWCAQSDLDGGRDGDFPRVGDPGFVSFENHDRRQAGSAEAASIGARVTGPENTRNSFCF